MLLRRQMLWFVPTAVLGTVLIRMWRRSIYVCESNEIRKKQMIVIKIVLTNKTKNYLLSVNFLRFGIFGTQLKWLWVFFIFMARLIKNMISMSVRFYWTDILVIRLFDVNRSYQFIDLSFIFSLPMLQLLRMHHDKCMFTCCDYIWFGSKMPNSILTHKSNQLSLFPLYQRPIFVILDHNNMCFTCTDKVTYRFSFFTSS